MSDATPVTILALERLKNGKIKAYTTVHDQVFTEDVIVKHQILKGRVLTSTEWSSALADEKKNEALARALRYLSYGSRSERQVRERLAKDLLPNLVISSVVTTLKAQGLIDDEAYAAGELDRAKRDLRGPIDLSRRLSAAVSPTLAARYVALYTDEDQERVLQAYLTKKTKTLPRKTKQKLRQSCALAAISRGFSPRFVSAALNEFPLPDNDAEQIAQDAEKILRRLSSLPEGREKNAKLRQRLLAQGYDSATIRAWQADLAESSDE